MSRQCAPDPNVSFVAVRSAAQRAALLFAKGIGEQAVLREAAAIFDTLCPNLPRRLAKCSRELAMAEAKARKPLPMSRPMTDDKPPMALLAALAGPALPGGQAATLTDAPGCKTASVWQSTGMHTGNSVGTGAEYARGNLRLISGGRSVAG